MYGAKLSVTESHNNIWYTPGNEFGTYMVRNMAWTNVDSKQQMSTEEYIITSYLLNIQFNNNELKEQVSVIKH